MNKFSLTSSGQKEKSNLRLYLIISFGALLRFVFFKWIGPIYYGKLNYFEQGDTSTWLRSIANLIHTGTYTYQHGIPNAEFFRPPGYAFFMLPFYLLSGQNPQVTYYLMAIAQTILDVVAIWFVFKIALKFFENNNYALFTAFMYACHPFIIVWNPLAQAESISIFFLLGGFYFLLHPNIKWNYVWSGLFIAALVLIRIQSIFIIFGFAAGFFYTIRKDIISLKNALTFFIAFSCLYGLWPLRNLVFHNRLLFLMDYRVGGNWSPDYLSFMSYVYTVQTDHQPEYNQIIFNKKVEWPAESYKFQGDSLLLDSVVKLARTCGTGFSMFMFNEKVRSSWLKNGPNCDSTIEHIFLTLAEKQRNQNFFHAWITIPMNNLFKAFFKTDLYGNKSGFIKVASTILFGYRSLLLLLGLAGVVIGFRNKNVSKMFLVTAITFMTAWYLYISFIYRNMEIRYLLQCDMLMLFPATYAIYYFWEKFRSTKVSQ